MVLQFTRDIHAFSTCTCMSEYTPQNGGRNGVDSMGPDLMLFLVIFACCMFRVIKGPDGTPDHRYRLHVRYSVPDPARLIHRSNGTQIRYIR